MYSYSRSANRSSNVTFGKYKCQPISTLLNDINYCTWLVQQEWVHNPKCPSDVHKYVEVRDQVLRRHPSLLHLVPTQYASTLPSELLVLNSNVYTSQNSESDSESTEELQWNSEEEIMQTTDDETESDESSQVYVVDKVLDHDQRPDGMYYLIKWQGYPNSENTHEHESNVSHDLLADYWKKMYFETLNAAQYDVKPWDDVPSTVDDDVVDDVVDDSDVEDEPVQVANSGSNSPRFQDTGYLHVHSIEPSYQVEPVAPIRRSARIQAKRQAW